MRRLAQDAEEKVLPKQSRRYFSVQFDETNHDASAPGPFHEAPDDLPHLHSVTEDIRPAGAKRVPMIFINTVNKTKLATATLSLLRTIMRLHAKESARQPALHYRRGKPRNG